MQTRDLEREINSVEIQIDIQVKKLGKSVYKDLESAKSKKLLHKIKLLREKQEIILKHIHSS